MKKTLILFLCLAVLVLSACSQPANPLFDLDHTPQASDTIKIKTEKDSYPSDIDVIRYSITNFSDIEQGIAGDSTCFTLLKLEDGVWKRVGTKVEHCWNEIALILPNGATENRVINLNDYFNLPLEKGEYCIEVERNISNTFQIS